MWCCTFRGALLFDVQNEVNMNMHFTHPLGLRRAAARRRSTTIGPMASVGATCTVMLAMTAYSRYTLAQDNAGECVRGCVRVVWNGMLPTCHAPHTLTISKTDAVTPQDKGKDAAMSVPTNWYTTDQRPR